MITCALMAVTVAGEFVAIGGDAFDQFRIALRDPAQGKKGGFGAVLVEHGQNTVHIAFNPAFPNRPFTSRNVRYEGRYLEVVFDVNGQRVCGG